MRGPEIPRAHGRVTLSIMALSAHQNARSVVLMVALTSVAVPGRPRRPMEEVMRRLYFVLPDVESARQMLDEMLLARIEERHVHFLARRGLLPDDLPEASALQKTDAIHGAWTGVVVGGVCGMLAGVVLFLFPPGIELELVAVLLSTIAGAMFGAWVSSMVGMAVPNSQLKRFSEDIDRGRVLMMIDVPISRVPEVTARVMGRHPEIEAKGWEPEMPAFP
jgi:hypothetical protein